MLWQILIKRKVLIGYTPTKITINSTKLQFPHKVKTEDYQLLSKIITFDSKRNELIIADSKKEANKGKKCLVLTERKDHV